MNNTADSSFPTRQPRGDPFRVLVCERSGFWARQLRRELGPSGPRVFEARVLADCGRLLEASPAAFLVVELVHAEARDALEATSRLTRAFPRARVAVVADFGLASARWAALEAGAAWFCCSPRRVAELSRMILEHGATVVTADLEWEEVLWNRLPWSEVRQ